jgi:hypothetical protein
VSGPFVPTLLALVAFAGNSVLCRLALGEGAIDAASFTTIRFASGAATLLLVSQQSRERVWRGARGDWLQVGPLRLEHQSCAFGRDARRQSCKDRDRGLERVLWIEWTQLRREQDVGGFDRHLEVGR